MILIFLALFAIFQAAMVDYLYNNPFYYQLDEYTWETDAFRSLSMGELLCREKSLDMDVLTTLMVEHDYDLTGISSLDCSSLGLQAAKPAEYAKLKQAYEMIPPLWGTPQRSSVPSAL